MLFGTGLSVTKSSEVLLVDETTIRSWHEKYVRGGEKELLYFCCDNKKLLLGDTSSKELAAYLNENIDIDSKAIAIPILKTDKIMHSPSGPKDLWHRIGFEYKKPKPYFYNTYRKG